jgi:hypothetical protein
MAECMSRLATTIRGVPAAERLVEETERVRAAMAQHALLSNGATASMDADRVSGGGGGGDLPRESESERFDRRLNGLVDRLAAFRRDVEEATERDRKRRPTSDTPQQREFWLIEAFTGVDYRTAAAETGLDERAVQAIRRKHGRDPRRGETRAA